MKLSVSLSDEDVEFLDEYAAMRGIASRSAAVHEAVQFLRMAALAPAYEGAWNEWTAGGDEERWDVTTGDGIG